MANPNGVKPADLAAHVARLHAAFVQTLTEDDIRAIARKLTEQAREGDRTSARLVLKYALGDGMPAAPPASAQTPAPKPTSKPSDAEFHAIAEKALREQMAFEAEMRRGGPGRGTPPPGNPRR